MKQDENTFKRKQRCFFTKTTPAYNYLVISVCLSFTTSYVTLADFPGTLTA